MNLRAILRDSDGLWPNAAALAYTLLGFGLGVDLLTRPGPWPALGVLLTAHTLVFAAYLLHEFAHGNIFRSRALNEAGGTVMGWICGACYLPFADLRRQHLRHHADRVDVVTFDYRTVLHRHPALARLVQALEWLYVPAVEVLMHVLVVALPFTDERYRHQRPRVAAVLLVRAGLFAGLAAVSPVAPLLYLAAWLLCLTVLRFDDAFQHTYPVVPMAVEPAAGGRPTRDFERQNTYSNLASLNWPWLNLLVLNFPYHNAHHERSAIPWYALPALHRQLYGAERTPQVLTWRELAGTYHRNRVRRVLAEEYGSVAPAGDRAREFIGALGVSFLTTV